MCVTGDECGDGSCSCDENVFQYFCSGVSADGAAGSLTGCSGRTSVAMVEGWERLRGDEWAPRWSLLETRKGGRYFSEANDGHPCKAWRRASGPPTLTPDAPPVRRPSTTFYPRLIYLTATSPPTASPGTLASASKASHTFHCNYGSRRSSSAYQRPATFRLPLGARFPARRSSMGDDYPLHAARSCQQRSSAAAVPV
ncbi:hypothetical protein MPH_08384 [Macrophomina phaseolina MS6]|uniref:Uncharacterized protein n=1 Tax=Macrophomina phaseolina (strain MS6) TaxID=1126212 RepID=K2SC14_MACPH|nr:hypothetical protein MPH_08384 [Macrophomina phaseolina MS6]